MKKEKNILLLLISIISIFIFNNHNVNATNHDYYKSYRYGDLVTIKLNENETKEFYIIADSTTSQNTVYAISKTVLGDGFSFTPKNSEFKDSLIDQQLKSLTVSWKTPRSIDLIGIANVNNNSIFQGDGASYWTNTITTEAAEFFPHIVKVNKNEDNSLTAAVLKITDANREDNKAYIRPVITVDKSYIIEKNNNEQDNTANDNNNQDESKTFWDILIKKLSSGLTSSTLSHTENTLTIINKDELDNTYTSNFTYKDGVLSLVPVDNVTLNQALYDQMVINYIIQTYSDIKGYNYEQVQEYIKKHPNLTLKDDGIEITYKEIEKEENNPDVSFQITMEIPVTFSMNLLKGFPSYEKYLATKNPISNDQTIDVPNTKETLPTYIKTTAIILILTGVALLIEENHRKRKILNK